MTVYAVVWKPDDDDRRHIESLWQTERDGLLERARGIRYEFEMRYQEPLKEIAKEYVVEPMLVRTYAT